MGLIYSFLTVTLRANQNVTGLALTTFGIGVSDYMIYTISKTSNVFSAASFATAGPYFTNPLIKIDVSGAAPWVQTLYNVFLSYGVFVYIALIIAFVSYVVLFKTRVGLHLRAVGENPATADAAGINVSRYRYSATCIGSAIAGLGGLCWLACIWCALHCKYVYSRCFACTKRACKDASVCCYDYSFNYYKYSR